MSCSNLYVHRVNLHVVGPATFLHPWNVHSLLYVFLRYLTYTKSDIRAVLAFRNIWTRRIILQGTTSNLEQRSDAIPLFPFNGHVRRTDVLGPRCHHIQYAKGPPALDQLRRRPLPVLQYQPIPGDSSPSERRALGFHSMMDSANANLIFPLFRLLWSRRHERMPFLLPLDPTHELPRRQIFRETI